MPGPGLAFASLKMEVQQARTPFLWMAYGNPGSKDLSYKWGGEGSPRKVIRIATKKEQPGIKINQEFGEDHNQPGDC